MHLFFSYSSVSTGLLFAFFSPHSHTYRYCGRISKNSKMDRVFQCNKNILTCCLEKTGITSLSLSLNPPVSWWVSPTKQIFEFERKFQSHLIYWIATTCGLGSMQRPQCHHFGLPSNAGPEADSQALVRQFPLHIFCHGRINPFPGLHTKLKETECMDKTKGIYL